MTIDTQRGHIRLKVAPGVALVRIKDPWGRLQDYYGERILPDWADHDTPQVLHFLDLGLVELCDDAGNLVDPGRVLECVSALIAVGLPADAGAVRARDALRAEGFRYRNDTIADAVKLRKSRSGGEAQ